VGVIRPQLHTSEVERRFAASQHAVASRAQLLTAGISGGAIKHCLETGRWRAMHRGVYLLGPVPLTRSPEMAAALAGGPDAYVSHEHGGHLHGFMPPPLERDPIHVTVVGRDPGPKPGLEIHRVRALGWDETDEVEGIPVTSPARTLVDLAASRSERELEELLAEAYVRTPLSRRQILRLLERYPRRHGRKTLAKLVDPRRVPARIRSQAERMFLALIRRAGLPRPLVNTPVCGFEVDFLWPRHRVVAEFDGHAFHASRPQRERDSRRDQELVLAGYVVIRITWRQLTEAPKQLVRRVAAILAQRAPSSGGSALGPSG
jgi:very-short-patch-repair endonuclease